MERINLPAENNNEFNHNSLKMGYFSQRKKHERENIFLKVMFITLGLITFLLLLPLSHQPLFEEVKRYLFQFYLLNLAVFLYSLYLSRFAYSALFALFLLINFTQIASTGNLFTDTAVRDDHHITLSHSAEKPLDINAYGMAILRSGHLNLTPEVQSQFVTFEKNYHVFTVVGVDFEGLASDVRIQAFRQLQKFVLMQDDPVIVVGDFGEPSWSPEMKDFLSATQLKVKNRMILKSRRYRFNPFAVPQFYVLAFDNVGIVSLDVERKPELNSPEVNVTLGFY